MLKRKITGVLVLLSLWANGQTIEWQPPLDIPLNITGGFGEIRPNHFHSGIDYSTQQQIRKPVLAVGDGWVSRIRQIAGGFGRALYITHPSGYTSVYAHLDEFNETLKRITIDYQIKNRTNEVDFELSPSDFPVKSGQFIAYSGNAGSSQAPHLHFELRDSKTQAIINPLSLGLNSEDEIAPFLRALCLYNIGNKPFSRQTERKIIALNNLSQGNFVLKGVYNVPQNILLGLGISCFDKSGFNPYTLGIYQMKLFFDDVSVFSWEMKSFLFEQTKAVNSCADRIGKYNFYKLFKDPGNTIPLFRQTVGDGKFMIQDTLVHSLKIIVNDYAGNISSVELKLRGSELKSELNLEDSNSKEGVWFRWNEINQFNSDNFKLKMPQGTLYDDCLFQIKTQYSRKAYSPVYHIGDASIPLDTVYSVWIKPENLPEDLYHKAVIVGSRYEVALPQREGDYLKANLKKFGSYHVTIDNVAPSVKYKKRHPHSKVIVLHVKDDLSGVKEYHAYIDEQWTPAEFDYKTHSIIIRLQDYEIGHGEHKLQVAVTDNVGNTNTVFHKFRY